MRRFLAAALVILSACSSSTPSETPDTNSNLAFALQGDPASALGATWTLRGTENGVFYDLEGVLFKPAGNGPFPAVIISHGFGGNARGYARGIATEMVNWGMVTIATNYTHATGVPLGSPGGSTELGASSANVQRAKQVHGILMRLGYVDSTRVTAHGHSMGAYVTIALIGAHPALFRAASLTAGGIRAGLSATPGAAPVESQVVNTRVPLQMHHGDVDNVVPISQAQRLDSLLTRLNVSHQLVVYPGWDHDDPSRSPLVLERVREWYRQWGVLP